MQVALAAGGGKEPLLDVRIGSTTFRALLDTGSSVSLFGPLATSEASSSGEKRKRETRTLHLASGWSQSSEATKCKIEWDGGSRIQKLICLPDLCQDVVLRRDFFTATGMSLHITLGGWTIGMEPQLVVPFAKPDKKVAPDPVDDANCLGNLFEEQPDVVACNTISGSGQQAEVMREFRGLLEEYEALFTKLPGCTTLIEHSIDTGNSTPVRTKLRPVN
ncbi:hypothetical protein MRX96_022057 [Rhipicephalus microplus]